MKITRNILLKKLKSNYRMLYKLYIKHALKQLRNNLVFQTRRGTMTSQHQTTACYDIKPFFMALDSWVLKTSKHEDCMTSTANLLHCLLVTKFLLYPNRALLVSFYAYCLSSSCHTPLNSLVLSYHLCLYRCSKFSIRFSRSPSLFQTSLSFFSQAE